MADENNTFGWVTDGDQALVTPHFEYHRKNRWVLEWLLPAGVIAAVDGAADALRLNCFTAARPSKNYDEATVHRINGEVHMPGKPHYEPMAVTFYDSIAQGEVPGGEGAVPSTSAVLEAWSQLIYQPTSGDAFGSLPNLKGLARLHMLLPQDITPGGNGIEEGQPLNWADSIAQSWAIIGCFPQNINYGDLSYENSEVQTVEVSIRYDRAYLVAPAALAG